MHDHVGNAAVMFPHTVAQLHFSVGLQWVVRHEVTVRIGVREGLGKRSWRHRHKCRDGQTRYSMLPSSVTRTQRVGPARAA